MFNAKDTFLFPHQLDMTHDNDERGLRCLMAD